MSGRPPPGWASRIVSLLTRRSERDFVLGDLEEEFRARARRTGRLRATLVYLAEGLRIPFTLGPGGSASDLLSGLSGDLRGVGRTVRGSPGLVAAIVLTIGVGVGSATSVFTVVRGILLEPLDFDEPDRVVALWGETPDYPRAPLTVGDYNVLADDAQPFASVAASWGNTALLLGGANPEQLSVGWVTPEYFDLLGIAPVVGGGLDPELESGLLLSHDLWVRRYGADPDVVGRVVDLGGASMTVVGVLPDDRNPNLAAFGGDRTDYDAWRLQPPGWTEGDDRSVGWLRATARLRDGVTVARAQAEIDALMRRVNETVTERDGGVDLRVNVIPARDDLVKSMGRTLWILFGAVCGVLLIAASNVAHLLLGRVEIRRREMAVRRALGGSRARLVRQLLVESGALAMAGGAAGVALAWGTVELLLRMAPPDLPRVESIVLNDTVLAFALVATGATALLFGLVPALRGTRSDPADALADHRSTADRGHQRFSRAIVVAQVALSLPLLAGTGLMVRSLAGLTAVDLGFARERVVTFAVELPDWGASDAEAAARMRDVERGVAGVPGVRAIGFANRVPLGGGLYTGTVRSARMAASDDEPREASVRYVSPGYFSALDARILAGRAFTTTDSLDVALLDEVAARRLFPETRDLHDVVGETVEVAAIGQDPYRARVVGVTGPMRQATVDEPPVETVFLPMYPRAGQQNFRYGVVGVDRDAAAAVPAIREAVRRAAPGAVLARVRTMDELVDRSLAARRFSLTVMLLFGGVATLLAAIGLHGVVAYSVRRRARETGIRVAIGARPRELLNATVGSTGLLVLGGIALGVVPAVVVGRGLGSLLFEVQPADPRTLLASAAFMLVVGLASTWVPARRILRTDPVETLRR